MGKSNLLAIFLSALMTFGFVFVSGQICVDSAGTFRPNTTYDLNRRLILSSLASNVTAQEGFFYNSSIGQEPNRVFAMGLCIPGSESKDCSDCLAEGVTELLQNCPNQT
ncbi:Cysteine-rich receptor-like protein kinase 11 [Cardamine amara subsp. amara]|uniref:Cysteine-rich receptor-like protein kinase 11 n=1 Tax=Cardamine amara subsp. amara TaxID=228776 RepID=A0ABD1BUI7_CARAN